jgi:hypothetical protein
MGMRRRTTLRFGVLAVLLVASAARALDPETVKLMPWVEQPESCLTCHPKDKGSRKLAEPTNSCDANCQRCHKDMDKHHSVGQVLEDKGNIALPLLTGNKVACISCHDLKTARTDRRSWKAQSLYARLFQGQSSYPTYYLRVNNSDGKLCRMCH